jgi:hypothetical protein
MCPDPLDRICHLIPGTQQHQPHESAKFINQQQKQFLAAWSGGLDGTTQVAMNHVKAMHCAVLHPPSLETESAGAGQ